MNFNTLMGFFASKIKGREFTIDPRVSFSYLLGFSVSYFFSLARGILRKRAFVWVGRNVRLVSSAQIICGRSVQIGDDCIINALSREGIVLGDNVSIQKRTIIECTGSLRFLGKGLKLGRNVGIGSCSFLGCAGGIEIGEDTIIGNYVSFHSENHNFEDPTLPISRQGVTHVGIKVGTGCWLGAKVTVLDGAIIEDGCIIAAGALVTQGRYLANSIYGGVPAKRIKGRFDQ